MADLSDVLRWILGGAYILLMAVALVYGMGFAIRRMGGRGIVLPRYRRRKAVIRSVGPNAFKVTRR